MPPAPVPSPASAVPYCPGCGYDLRGSDASRCPECGRGVDVEALRRVTIPWERRRQEGRVRTFFQTVWAVTSTPRRFVQDAGPQVRMQDAVRFRRVLAGVVWVEIIVGLMITGALLPVVGLSDGPALQTMGAWVQGLGWLGVMAGVAAAVGLWLWALAITGVHTYWFHPPRLPRQQQYRALALSHYAMAPLALAFAAVLPLALGYTGAWLTSYEVDGGGWAGLLVVALLAAGLAIVPGLVVWSWLTTARWAGLLAKRGGWAQIGLLLALPVLWTGLGVLTLVGVPVVAVYAWLMGVSW